MRTESLFAFRWRSHLQLPIAAAMLLPTLGACGSPASELEVGACISNPGSPDSGHRVNVTSCHDPHYGEIIAKVEVPGGNYPGTEVLTEECRGQCREAFEEVIGVPPERSVFDLFPLLPSEGSWDRQEDRTIYCVVRSSTGDPLTEPVGNQPGS